MSKFLETPTDTLSLGSLKAIAGRYILEEFHEYVDSPPYRNRYLNDDGVAELQNILENSNHKLRMYGSAQELAENLKIYKSFPGMDKFFDTETDLYNTDAVIYKSLKGEEYICKPDLFVILQNMTLSNFPGTNSEEVRLAVMSSVKCCQKQNPFKKLEFVKFDQHWFDTIEKELREAHKICYTDNSEIEILRKELASGNFKGIISKFRSISDKKTWNEAGMLQNFKKMYDIKKDALYLAQVLVKSVIMKTIPNIINKRSDMFLPRRQTSKTNPMFVRVFEDNDEQFVMKAEFFNAIKLGYEDKNDNFLTIRMQEVEEKYGARIKDLEFIRFPILRAKHRAVPIHEPMSIDKFCVPAVDGFFDFAKTLIFGIKVFQKYGVSNLNELFKAIEIGFLPNESNPYFTSMKAIDELRFNTIEFIKKTLHVGITKDVRNAKTDGFTVQNLKNELAHLNLTKAFPEIQNHAEIVYSEVDKRKKEQVLRTCDLFDAVEHCQLICILDRLPNYKKFLHNQKGCHRVYGYQCEQCEKEKKEIEQTLELQKPSEPAQIKEDEQKTLELQNSSRIENLERELAEMKLHLEKVLMENQKLQSENQKLSVENDAKALTSSKSSEIKILDSNPDTALACTSNRILCLICDCHVDSSNKDDVIRCPLCKRRFHKKCAFEWLKEHSQCPACNGELPKI